MPLQGPVANIVAFDPFQRMELLISNKIVALFVTFDFFPNGKPAHIPQSHKWPPSKPSYRCISASTAGTREKAKCPLEATLRPRAFRALDLPSPLRAAGRRYEIGHVPVHGFPRDPPRGPHYADQIPFR